MNTTRRTVAALALATLTLAACGYSQDAPVTPRLEGDQWTLSELYNSTVRFPVGQDAPSITFDAAERTAAGSTGCNRFSAPYVLTEDRVNFGPAIVTQMACPEPMNSTETRFLRALEEANRVQRVGSVLELLSGDVVIARFRAS